MTTDKVLAAIKRLRVETGSLACLGCGHELMTPRFKAEKNIRSVERKETSDS